MSLQETREFFENSEGILFDDNSTESNNKKEGSVDESILENSDEEITLTPKQRAKSAEKNSSSNTNSEKLSRAEKAEKSKSSENKNKNKKSEKEKVESTSKYHLSLNFDQHTDTYLALEETFSRVNNKNVGKVISREDIISKLLKYIDDDFVLELQKESLSNEELNYILKLHIGQNSKFEQDNQSSSFSSHLVS